MFSKSIIWIIPLKTLYNLNFECIFWMLEWIVPSLRSFLFFYVMFYLQRCRALEFLVIILLPCSFSLELYWNDFSHSRENCVVSVRKDEKKGRNPITYKSFSHRCSKKNLFISRKILCKAETISSRLIHHLTTISYSFLHSPKKIIFRIQFSLISKSTIVRIFPSTLFTISKLPKFHSSKTDFWHWHISHIPRFLLARSPLFLCYDKWWYKTFSLPPPHSNCHNPLDFRLTRFIFSCAWCMRVKVSWMWDRDEKWKLAG